MIRKMIIENRNKTRMSSIVDGVLERFNKDDLVDGVYVVPNEVHTIRAFAFSEIMEIKRVILPATLKRIEYIAFANCGLEEIEIPEGITEIEIRTFIKCPNLTKVILPTTLNRIHTNAFDGCNNLKEISVPKDAIIAKDAFGDSKINVLYQQNQEATL